MSRVYVSNRAVDIVGDYIGMPFLIKIGILVLLITCSIGRNIPNENYEETNSTSYDEEPLENNCNCEWRYYKHYETKGCQVMQVDSCGCPKKFLCPLTSGTSEEQKICLYQNQEYKMGSRLNITDKCQSCRCLALEDQAQIVCRHKECPQLEYVGDRNCHLVYEKDHCCPSKYECALNTNENEATGEDSFCVHDGITYPLGAKIYPSDDPCLICDCTENWRGISNTSCYQQNCLFEKNKLRLQRGCIPVYHENKCCPIEFYCPDEIASDSIPLESFMVENFDDNGDKCVFGDKSFELGAELPMENPCIKCSCLVPPDFTCVHESCPPSLYSKNCQAMISSNYCCPSYDCSVNDVSETDVSNSSKPDVSNSSGNECPTPQCADATCVIKIPEGHTCPTCVCNESVTHEKNLFETTDEVLMEGPENNSSSSTEVLESENENLEAEVLIPIESDSSNNKSEKFIETIDTFIGNIDYDEREHSEFEDVRDIIFDKESEIVEDKEELSFQEQPEHINLEVFPGTSLNISEDEENESETHRKKRSVLGQHIPLQQQGSIASNHIAQNSQQQFFEEEEPESNREISEDNDEGFDELKFSSMDRKNLDDDDNSEGDLISSESVIVPDGCPTPLCANSSCKIAIPVGQRCPACICKNREVWQP